MIASFEAALDERPLRLRLTAFPVFPGQVVELSAEGGHPVRFAYQSGSVVPDGVSRWRWRAPDAPGAYALRLTRGGETIDLTALVVHPAEYVRDGVLLGYRIGEYPSVPLRGEPAYLPPPGFVEVRRDQETILVSPRLELGQFLCKQSGDPRFLVLSRPLLFKLESLLDRIAAVGYAPESLVVMSGFRTPAYNRAIGNTTVYSRHLWGDAADIYLDADDDGEMDDLNRDGRIDVEDARVLARAVEEVAENAGVRPGGLAVYHRNADHGPFVHVDARGSRARW